MREWIKQWHGAILDTNPHQIILGEICPSASPPTMGSAQLCSVGETGKIGHFYFAENRTFLFGVDTYLIFELADDDIRRAIGRIGRLEDAAKLRYLHEVAVGLNQLHNNHVAHQDLKPSNVLLFDSVHQGAKIGDLGRASRKDVPAVHDGFQVTGDRAYAPPEQLYGISAPDWVDRRLACDAFHLGGLVTFLFCGVTPLTGLERHLPEEYWPGRWHGSYEDVLPHLVNAFSRFLESLAADFPPWAKDELQIIVSQLCHPDYMKRGDPKARQMHGRPVGIDRFVSRFDRMAKRAMVEARKP